MTVNLVSVASAIAQSYHLNQKYGKRDYFKYHIEGVVKSLSSCGYDNEYLIVAYLHDILEDTHCRANDIFNHFNQEILDSVIALTKGYCGKEDRLTYLQRCKNNEIARIVKCHDLSFNLLNCIKEGKLEKAQKYINNLQFLNN